MAKIGQRQGCTASTGSGKDPKPKTIYWTRDAAHSARMWMIDHLGASPEKLRVYECRYSGDEPHFHVGGIPLKKKRNYGRRT